MIDRPGFADPVADAQSCFRAVLNALAHPGRIVQPATAPLPPTPLDPVTGGVLLTLADGDTPVWLDPAAQAAGEWVQFHCGSPIAGPHEAAFAVCLDLPDLGLFDWGSHDGPEESATIILQRPSLDGGAPLRLSGPGLREPTVVHLGLPAAFADAWRPNRAAFPRGVDLILCSGDTLAALPRSLTVELP